MKIILAFFISLKVFAFSAEEQTGNLKQDLDQEANRRSDYHRHQQEREREDKEREKGLALFLEEQEKWDLARSKAAIEHKKTIKKSLDENSPEYFADVKEKVKAEEAREAARKNLVKEKQMVISHFNKRKSPITEEDELQIYTHRPRYDLRKRAHNKWLNSGSKTAGSGSSGSFGGGSAPPAPVPNYGYDTGVNFQGGDNYDFPPPPPPADFNNIPQDGFDDFPPPPAVPPSFDGVPTDFDSGFGDGPQFPPPSSNWDF
ncbi:MAG: hypothetical protein ACK41T_12045 [Pseudobdellovibrio sp.]